MTDSEKKEYLSPRETGRLIAAHSRDVSINSGGVEVAAAMLAEAHAEGAFSMKAWKQCQLHPNVANNDAVDFIFVMDTLNFCFWPDDPQKQFTVIYGGKSYTRYRAMVASLKRAVEEGVPITSAKYISTIDETKLRKIFRSENEADIPMLKERVQALNEAGTVLLKKFEGSFVNCLKACDKNVLTLLNMIVNNFKSYQDVSEFEGKKVAFYKRAQILVADIWLCFEGQGLGEFTNIDELTMFADYRVPQALEYFGVLKYSNELKQVLDNCTVLDSGNRYELEIRGCSIEAVERLQTVMKEILSKTHDSSKLSTLAPINSVTVDNYLWTYAKQHAMKMEHLQHHQIRTIYY